MWKHFSMIWTADSRKLSFQDDEITPNLFFCFCFWHVSRPWGEKKKITCSLRSSKKFKFRLMCKNVTFGSSVLVLSKYEFNVVGGEHALSLLCFQASGCVYLLVDHCVCVWVCVVRTLAANHAISSYHSLFLSLFLSPASSLQAFSTFLTWQPFILTETNQPCCSHSDTQPFRDRPVFWFSASLLKKK